MIPFSLGFLLGVRFLIYVFRGESTGHIQSLILASTLLMMGFMTIVVGILADIIAAERKILEDVQVHARKTDYRVSELKKDSME